MSRRHNRTEDGVVYDISRARLIQGLKNLHSPYDLYEACSHNHALNDPLAQEIKGLGMVCDEGIVATICNHCCVNGAGQREECATEHKHLPSTALCPTMAVVEGREPPWRA